MKAEYDNTKNAVESLTEIISILLLQRSFVLSFTFSRSLYR